MTSIGLCFTSVIITFDQNQHHLYSSSVRGKDLSNDTQIRVIESVEPGICMKMLRNLTEKFRAKPPVTTHGTSFMVDGQSLLQQKYEKKRKRKGVEKNMKKLKA